MLKGVAASPGIGIGKVYKYEESTINIHESSLQKEEIESQIDLLDSALIRTKHQLSDLITLSREKLGEEKAEIFEAHLMILEDEEFINDIRNNISSRFLYADAALQETLNKYIDIFSAIENEYIKERIADIKDVCGRLMKNILGLPIKSLGEVTEESIVVAKDLTPSDTAQIDKTRIKAFCTDIGGRTSHTAIMARLQEIPAVVGLSDITSKVKDGDIIIVDGNKGEVHINPAPHLLEKYQKLKEEYEQYQHSLKSLKDLPAETAEKARRVELAANIGSLKDCENAMENGAEGIGLFRTEFLYMDRSTLPDEQEQFEIYKAVASRMSPHPVIIRTLDIGGDKKTPCLELPDEMNPFLGWRAIRICLDRPDIFKTQLRAILRASSYGSIRIMYPMISNITELRSANSVLHEAMDELDREQLAYNKKIEVGIMVEIPSAAVTADLLIKEADFFSIGTNDLIQYTIAVDRMNERISHLYEPFNPAVLRLIKNVIDASHKAGKWTGMCGELAGDAAAVPILLGMGLDEFSMSAASILKVKKVIRSLTMHQAQEIADKALSLETPEMIREMLRKEQPG